MNKTALLFCILAGSFAPLIAADPADSTALQGPHKVHSEYVILPGENLDLDYAFGPSVKYTQFNDKSGILVGLHAGIFFNKHYNAFIEISRLSNEIQFTLDSTLDLHATYLSFGMSYVFMPEKMVHFSLGTLFGVGNLVYRVPNRYYYFGRYYGYQPEPDAVALIEPEATVVLNVNDFIKLNVGASYRVISGVVLRGLSDTDMSGPSLVVRLSFGSF